MSNKTTCNKAMNAAVFLSIREMEKRGILDISKEGATGIIQKLKEYQEAYIKSTTKKIDRSQQIRAPFDMNIITKDALGAINFIDEVDADTSVKYKSETISYRQSVDVLEEKRVLDTASAYEVREDSALNIVYPYEGDAFVYLPMHNMGSAAELFVREFFRRTDGDVVRGSISFKGAWISNGCRDAVVLVMSTRGSAIADGIAKLGKTALGDIVLPIDDKMGEIIFQLLEKEFEKREDKPEFDIAYVNALLVDTKEFLTKKSKLEIIDTFSQLKTHFTDGKKELVRFFQWNGLGEAAAELEQTKKNNFLFELNIDTAGDVDIPYKEKKDDTNHVCDFLTYSYQEIDKSLSHYNRYVIEANKMILGFNKTIYKRVSFDENRVMPLRDSNTMMSKSSFYTSALVSSFPIVSIDEADMGIKGKKSSVSRAIAANARNIITSTGTATTGKPSQMAWHIGAQGMSLNQIENTAQEITETCGVYEIKSDFIKTLMTVDTRGVFGNTLKEVLTLKMSGEAFSLSMISRKFVNFALKVFKENSVDISNYNPVNASKDIEKLINMAFATSSINSKASDYRIVSSILVKGLSLRSADGKRRTPSLLREAPGINNPKTFASIIKSQDGNPSIQTRENLKGRKETFYFSDYAILQKTEANLKEQGVDISLEDAEVEKKLLFDFLKTYTLKSHLFDVGYLLSSLFEVFVESIKMNDNTELIIPEGMDRKMFLSILAKSSVSVNNGMENIYREYLKSNGSFARVETIYGEEKAKLFFVVLQKFQDIVLDNLPELRSQVMQVMEGNITDVKLSGIVLKGAIEVPETFVVGEDETPVGSFEFENGYPSLYGRRLLFSITMELENENWDFVKELPLWRYEFTNNKIQEVIDIYTGKGVYKEITTDILEHSLNLVVTSDRTLGSVFNLYNIVSVAANREVQDTPFVIIVNKVPEVRDAIRKMDSDFLMRNNILIEETASNQVQSIVNNYKKKGFQYSIISNYISIARGVDLSSLDKIIATGALTQPDDAIQMLARLFSVNRDDGVVSMFHGGKEIDISGVFMEAKQSDLTSTMEHLVEQSTKIINGKEALDVKTAIKEVEKFSSIGNFSLDKEHLKIPYTQKVNKRIHDSNEVYRGFMGGTLLDTKKTSPWEDVLTVSKAYQDVISQKLSEEQEPANNMSGVKNTLGVVLER